MGAAHYSRYGCPDMDVHTSGFEGLQHGVRPQAADDHLLVYTGRLRRL